MAVMKVAAALACLLLCHAIPALAAEGPPIPKPRPERGLAPPPPSPPEAVEEAGWPDDVVAEARAQCEKLLAGLPLTYTPLAPIGNQGGCGAPAPILITAVAGVALKPAATQTCDMGAALAGWIAGSVKPAAEEMLQARVTVIHTGTSYNCRRRNNSPTGKMSEHSKANGLDLAGFSFATDRTMAADGNWGQGLAVGAGLPEGGSFLDTIRKSACTSFTTVLGPGSDASHGDHFHLDVLRRKNDYRICQ